VKTPNVAPGHEPAADAPDVSVQGSGRADAAPAAPTATATATALTRRHRLKASQFGLVVAYLVIVGTFWSQRPDVFSSWQTWQGILDSSALPAIVAMALTVTLIVGDFDLSIGATIGFAMAVTAAILVNWHWGWVAASAVAIGCAVMVGLVNGLLVTGARVNSFIATLAMSSVVGGLDAKISNQRTISTGIPTNFTDLGVGRYAGFGVALWVAVVLGLALYVLIGHTENGRYLFAVGGNREAARLAGVRTRSLRTIGMVTSSIGAAVVGILLCSQTASYYPNAGAGYLLPAYAAAFLGTALGGGRFGIVATAFGVLFLQTLQTGLTVLNVQPWTVMVVQGAVLAIAVIVSTSNGLRLPGAFRRRTTTLPSSAARTVSGNTRTRRK
jgi:ribose transport system permease protein